MYLYIVTNYGNIIINHILFLFFSKDKKIYIKVPGVLKNGHF